MIYQPRNVYPSASAIDVGLDNTFSMEIQTNNYVSAYQLSIVDFSNNEIYNGSKVDLENFVYNGETLDIPIAANSANLSNGNNYKWRVRLYQPTANMLITYGVVQSTSTTTNIYLQENINIRENMSLKIGTETRTILSYDVDTGLAVVSSAFSSVPAVETQYYVYSDFIETVPDYVFYARQTPTVSINAISNPVTSRHYDFQGVYSQSDNVPIIYYIYNLYMKNNDGSFSLIDTTDRVYSARLTYSYDSLRSGNVYAIELIVENDMGTIVSTNQIEFNVSYDIIEYLQQPTATFDSSKNAVNISWTAPVEHTATTNSIINNTPVNPNYLYNVPYTGVNSLYTNGYTATWSSESGLFEMPSSFNITMQFSPDEDFFFDENGNYYNLMPIISTLTEESNGNGAFGIIIDEKSLVYLTPLIEDNAIKTIQIATPPSGEENTSTIAYVSEAIDISQNPYVYFQNQEFLAKIIDFDDSTNKVTFESTLPFIPSVGDILYLNNSLSTDLYSNTTSAFVLAQSNFVNPDYDYIWMDDATWNDDYFWVEGGTPIQRVCGHWWKLQITNSTIKAEEVYVNS